jgi:regulator of PEP synthase PpsR (kinase-PPPase family)
MHQFLVVSDGTGGTAEQMLRALLTQFAGAQTSIQRRPEIRTEEQARAVIEEAARLDAFVVHTVVSNQLRRAIGNLGRLYDVPTLDLLGPPLARLAEQFDTSPSETPGLVRALNREYFQRIEAMEFAFRHDDGQHVDELANAEIVLLGVSRTFKTPVSMYLAFRGWMVANVPIVLDLPVPPILFALPPDRVFGLTTTPHRLALLRRMREEHLGGSAGRYATLEHVTQELAYARRLYGRGAGWRIVDVTDRSIEEIAADLIAGVRQSGGGG